MENNHDHIRLTSSEISALWETFINNSLEICSLTYFLKDVEDPDIRTLLEYGLDISNNQLETIKNIFNQEKFPLPVGLTENDVNLNAPRLFSDTFMLYYTQNIGASGLNIYSIALPNSARADIRGFYTSCLETSAELFNRTCNALQEKGIFIRSPYIPYPNQTEFVHKQHFLAGWFGEKRRLTTMEITSLFFNYYRNSLGSYLLTGFSQVAQAEDIRRFLVRGAEIAKHHCEVFRSYLSEENLLTPTTWGNMPLTSTTAPFSDKFMMFHTTSLNTLGIGYYGASIGMSSRRDLSLAYSRLISETSEFAEDGTNIMIENGWLEKPPSAPERKELARR